MGVNKLVGLKKEKRLTNEETLEVLVDEYWISVKKLAYTYVKDWALAEDVTQEVFIKCYNNLARFRGDSSYKTWLYKITVNRCKDEFRSKWYRNLNFLNAMGKTVNNSISAEQSFLEEDERKEFYEIVLGLPMKYREVIILFYYEEMSLDEIHNLLDTNINTVKSRLKRGKLLLKNMVEGGSFNGR